MEIKITDKISVGAKGKLLFIAGPCVIESEKLCMEVANHLKCVAEELDINIIFKASFDKANRSSVNSFRGVGISEGIDILQNIKKNTGLPILTDIHLPEQAEQVAKIVDIIQIPAFLCRQTDLLIAAAKTDLPVNVKKGQFLAPDDVVNIKDKIFSTGNKKLIITERGSSFGYNNLVVDMKAIPTIQNLGLPVIFDATHSVQKPGGGGSITTGDRDMVFPLAKAATAIGADGFFMEVHPNPEKALSDSANTLDLNNVKKVFSKLIEIKNIVN